MNKQLKYKLWGYYWYNWMDLNPTGLCKTVKNEYGTKKYIQHKGLIFKKWINENDISEFECSEVIEYCPEVVNPTSTDIL